MLGIDTHSRFGRQRLAIGVSIAIVAASTLVGATFTRAEGQSAISASHHGRSLWRSSVSYKPRTVITTDGEQDDRNSMIRYLAYSDDFDTLGLVYTSSEWHWAGNGKGTQFDGLGGEATSHRWLGTTWIQNMLRAYAKEYPNFKTHDPNYPSPQSLMRVVRVGNIDFPGEMSHDTPGSNLIKKLLLDNNPNPLYLQAWGGLNTIARALKSIQQEYQDTSRWPKIYDKVSTKAIIEASGFQDAPRNPYTSYIAPNWPRIQVNDDVGGYFVWAYPDISRQPVENRIYYSGAWMKKNIVDQGPLGAWEYTYGDGRDPACTCGTPEHPGDPGYHQWDGTYELKYTFVSEGDDVAFLGLIPNGLQSDNPTYGGWGGRLRQETITPDLFVNVASDTYTNGKPLAHYDWSRWFPAEQRNFAARMKWGVTPESRDANHAPVLRVPTGNAESVQPGSSVLLRGTGSDPDGRGNKLTVKWWQYRDAGSYAGVVHISSPDSFATRVTIPRDARPGQTIQLIMQVTNNGTPAMTSYQRVVLTVVE